MPPSPQRKWEVEILASIPPFILSSKSVIYIKNNKGPNTDPCGIPLKTEDHKYYGTRLLSRVVSSAYMIGQKLVLAVARSLIYILGIIMTRIKPWGTPVVNVSKDDFMWLNSTYCCLCSR